MLSSGLFDNDMGLVYTGDFHGLGIQLLGATALVIWPSILSAPYFYIILKLNRLRVHAVYEIIGLDYLLHEESDKIIYIPIQG